MRKILKDEDITKILKKMGKIPVDGITYDRVWFKLEERLEKREKSFLDNVVWRPWGHPIRWVAAAACLLVTFTGVLYNQKIVEQADLAAYVETVSNPTANVTKDLGIVHVSALITEGPSPSVHEAFFSEGDHTDSLLNDELSL